MAQKKLERFHEIGTFGNVLQYPVGMEGKWKHFFKNNHPVILELACGKGEYTVQLATMHPEKNYVGVDIKGTGSGWVQGNVSGKILPMLPF